MPESRKNSSPLCKPLLLALLTVSSLARAVDMEELWVPKSYVKHLPRLYDAAEQVEAYPGCSEVLDGTTHLGRTTDEHPVFTITCRDPHGQSFSLMVDGPTLMKVDETRPGGLVSFEQLRTEYELAREREREQARKEQELAGLREERAAAERERQQWLQWWEEEYRRRESIWDRCVERLQTRVGGMRSLEWLTRTMPEPEMAQEPSLEEHPPLTFVIDFNAESYYGEPLYYRAYCEQQSEGGDDMSLVLDIDPRRDQEPVSDARGD